MFAISSLILSTHLKVYLSYGVTVLLEHLLDRNRHLAVLGAVGRNVRLALEPALLLEACYHHHRPCALLHNHAPQVGRRVHQRALSGNVGALLPVVALREETKRTM